jgi:hypothetical protein
MTGMSISEATNLKLILQHLKKIRLLCQSLHFFGLGWINRIPFLLLPHWLSRWLPAMQLVMDIFLNQLFVIPQVSNELEV